MLKIKGGSIHLRSSNLEASADVVRHRSMGSFAACREMEVDPTAARSDFRWNIVRING